MKRRETIFINNPLSRYFLQSYQEERSRSPCGGRSPSHSLERAGEMKFVREPQLFRHFLRLLTPEVGEGIVGLTVEIALYIALGLPVAYEIQNHKITLFRKY